MSNFAFILVHKGEGDPESKKVLDAVNKSGVIGITKITVDEDTEEWLRHNTKGVVVTNYPSFLVAQEGRNTQVYTSNETSSIIEILKSATTA